MSVRQGGCIDCSYCNPLVIGGRVVFNNSGPERPLL